MHAAYWSPCYRIFLSLFTALSILSRWHWNCDDMSGITVYAKLQYLGTILYIWLFPYTIINMCIYSVTTRDILKKTNNMSFNAIAAWELSSTTERSDYTNRSAVYPRDGLSIMLFEYKLLDANQWPMHMKVWQD